MGSIDEFKNIPVSIFEAAFNKWLSLDPEVNTKLESLTNKCIAIKIRGIETTIFLIPNEQGIYIRTSTDKEPDIIFSGTPIAFLQLIKKVKLGKTIASSEEIAIEGNSEIASKLGDIFSSIEIDWEEHLSRIIGDTATRKISITENHISQWVSASLETAQEDLRDYLREEKKITVTPDDMENFSQDINNIRNNIERLEQRIARLEPKITSTSIHGTSK